MIAVGNSSTNLHKHTFALSIWALRTLWTPWEIGQEKRRSPPRPRVLHKNMPGERMGFRKMIYFPPKYTSPPQKGDFQIHRMWWACPQGGSPAGEEPTLSLQRTGCGSTRSLHCAWGADGKYNYLGMRVSSPMFPEKNQDSGGCIGPVCGEQEVSSKKMVERKGDVCNSPALVVP